jgi:hypothetical protein
MNLSREGTLGRGIYFADSVGAAIFKGHGKGAVIVAFVTFNRPVELEKQSPNMTLSWLNSHGYDSVVCEDYNRGTEYAVYETRWVSDIQILASYRAIFVGYAARAVVRINGVVSRAFVAMAGYQMEISVNMAAVNMLRMLK